MSTGDDDQAAPFNAIYQQVITNTQNIQDNAEIIQTKTSGPDPSINNSVARFVGIDGKTVQSSNVVVDDMGDVGIGTTNPVYNVDIRTPGQYASQIHLTSDDVDSGGYLTSAETSGFYMSAGSAFASNGSVVAKAVSASIMGGSLGALAFYCDTGLTVGNTYVPNRVLYMSPLDLPASTLDIGLVNSGSYNRLVFPQVASGPPTLGSRSTGEKIVLYPITNASLADLAIGIDANTMWFGHFDATASRLFKWYGGTTEIMRLEGDGDLLVRQGQSTGFAAVGGTIFDHYVDANNTGTAETDLYSDTIPASSLGENGDKISATYQLVASGVALSTQQMKVYFGGTLIYDSGALSMGAITSNFTFEVLVVRVSASVVRCSVAVSSDFATLFPYSKYTEVTGLTLSNTQVLKITGTAAGAAGGSNQITAKLGTVAYLATV